MRRSRAAAGLALLVLASGCSGGSTPGAGPSPEPTRSAEPTGSTTAADRPPDPLAPALAGTPRLPRSPRRAADQITAAERAIAAPATSARRLAAAGHTQQLAYRVLADRPGWDSRVRALLPRPLRAVAADNVAARRAFRSMHPTRPADLATELPAWRIVAPRPAAELRRHYREAERRYGVEWEYLAAINLVETGFGRIHGTSVAGAQGPMQFLPTTWAIYGHGGDIRDPRDAILAAGRLLRANGFAEDPAAALYRYNNHSAYVRGVTLYAEVMKRRPRAFLGYHQWPVYYLTRRGSILLPEGYAERRPVPLKQWLADRD
jgi:membrane-bound lytic murein transglycosylase B